ncbi:hypothetical protein FACS1894109_08110 [Spirochaetia bacterium]|nr:hypothetical protein FACS1894109_08110 [Spirochaetia bacterium]
MKFKFIFILSNIIILFLSAIFLMNFAPLMALIPGTGLIILDILYFSNRRLFLLMERGDYPALSGYLEMRVLRRGHYFPPLVRLLADTYLAMADTAGVMNLENKAALVKPALLESNAFVFGTARLLAADNAGAVRFFAARLEPAQAGRHGNIRGRTRKGPQAAGRNLPWVRWYYGFSLLLDRQFTPAAEQFRLLAEDSSDILIAGLSAYFLGTTLQRNADNGLVYLAAAQQGRSRVQKAVQDKTGWLAKAGKLKHEVHTVILQKYIEEAGDWLFGG